MLSIAATGFTIPFERLKDPYGPNLPHPSGNSDDQRFEESKVGLDELYSKQFVGSALWSGKQPDAWYSGKVKRVDLVPEYWEELEDGNLRALSRRNNREVRSVLDHLRNALAHGNIYTMPGENNQIKRIIFVSEKLKRDKKGKSELDDKGKYTREDFGFLMCSPTTFYMFLQNWFGLLKTLSIPRGFVTQLHTHDAQRVGRVDL